MQMVERFADRLKDEGLSLNRGAVETLQINVGKLCNQACLHCHVEAGPNKKRENMDEAVAERLISLAAGSASLRTVDLTGGAPELNPQFRRLVLAFRAMGKEVIDRCNLTILLEEGQNDTALFLAEQGVHVVASLPCYSRENVEKQRGDGVFDKSIRGLQLLNELGYGRDPHLHLDLVYNPTGPFLPPPQEQLEADYKLFLREEFGIRFNRLLTITNMPIKRFLFDLKAQGKLLEYRQLLADSFNLETIDRLMCRSMVSVGWDGQVYDCDFNQMLNIPASGKRRSVFEVSSLDELSGAPVAVADHCYGCTAGCGSSCGGALS